ncbi:complement C1q and tumor necrosis factor-related protein 9A-like [Pomacea canaliculata]|uniref:complement C1q and tumor necrosis factor-related protein 9A-like n=1 Tax=Pomacea canaliculata TaxID=400727 RepID=UPI000D7341FF|nr:complement C1q and tumor necrosis factor-related protein 9A-like [Pomacea canaliculata]
MATLEGELTAVKNEVTVIKNGLPRSFQQVAFTVRFSTDENLHGILISSGQTLKFDSVITNLGNAYDASTGVFTAPISGLYTFHLVAMVPLQARNLDLAVIKGSIPVDHVYANSQSPDAQGSTQYTIHLTAGEMVWVQQVGGDGVRGGDWTVFTGYLLAADKPS